MMPRLKSLWITVLLLVASSTTVAALSSSSTDRKLFTEILPLKAAMLTKNWQGLLLDVDQKVGIVPDELGSAKNSVGVKRFGPEMERRTLCARQFERCYESTFALAMADKDNPPDIAQAKRLAILKLLIDGEARGPRCATFACLTSPATISLVEQLDDEWSVLALTVNPTERAIEAIVASELAMLTELCTLATNAKASLRVLADVQKTFAGDSEQLCLTPIPNEDGEPVWFRCDA